jgi:hypothetical protein
MFRFLQDYPHAMERLYDGLLALIRPLRRWLKPGSRAARLLVVVEKAGKGAVFDCRMCGQCILHSTGMTCPMTCPKNLRNGPCGGVRANGRCEVKPELRCVWVQAYERANQMPKYGRELIQIQPPLNRKLEGTASWVNVLHGIDAINPAGWTTRPELLSLRHQDPAP